MKPEKVVLCASSKYEQKFYLNEEFKGLPEEIKKELEKTKNYTKEYTEKLKQILAEKTESLNIENLTNPNKDSDKSLKN